MKDNGGISTLLKRKSWRDVNQKKTAAALLKRRAPKKEGMWVYFRQTGLVNRTRGREEYERRSRIRSKKTLDS